MNTAKSENDSRLYRFRLAMTELTKFLSKVPLEGTSDAAIDWLKLLLTTNRQAVSLQITTLPSAKKVLHEIEARLGSLMLESENKVAYLQRRVDRQAEDITILEKRNIKLAKLLQRSQQYKAEISNALYERDQQIRDIRKVIAPLVEHAAYTGGGAQVPTRTSGVITGITAS